MAYPSSNSATAKTLKEHLQQQQEPFILDTNLVRCLSSNGRNGCCQTNLFKNLNKKMLLLSTRIVKSIVYKLTSVNDSQLELSCCSDRAFRDEFRIAETNGFTEVNKGRLITPNGHSPNWSVEEESLSSKHRRPQASNLGDEEEEKTLTDKTWQRECTQEKHLNLMSALDKLSSERVHHIITRQDTLSENARGNFVFTVFPWKWLGKSLIERYSLIGFKEVKGIVEPCSRHQTNKDLMNQSAPSLNLPEKFVKSNVIKNARNKYNYIHWFIGAENLGSLIRADQIDSCRKNFRYSRMDFFNTVEEWNYARKVQRKISFELGDSIMEDIVEEIIDLLLQ